MARAPAPTPCAIVCGNPVSFLHLDCGPRPVHLVTPGGAFQLDSTIRYGAHLNVEPYNSPFRPHRFNEHMVQRIEVTAEDVLLFTTGGTVRIPAALVSYSYQ